MLIPPSLLLILYAILAEQSVGHLFLAGVFPGLLMACGLATGVMLMVRLLPGLTGDITAEQSETDSCAATELLRRCLPLFVLITFVIGGIYGGFFTPVEASAVGCIFALIIAVVSRSLTIRQFTDVLKNTGKVSSSICFMIIAARMYSRMLSISGLPTYLASQIDMVAVSVYGFVFAYVLLIIALGMILDSASVMLIVLPLALPIVSGMPIDLVWFGIVTVIAVEIGLITPPFGLSVFVIHSTLNSSKCGLQVFMTGYRHVCSLRNLCIASCLKYSASAFLVALVFMIMRVMIEHHRRISVACYWRIYVSRMV